MSDSHPVAANPTPIGVAIVEHEGRFLVGVRAVGSVLEGLVEFPGGKRDPGESAAACAVRECFEETGLVVAPLELIDTVSWDYPHGPVELSFVRCKLADRVPTTPRDPYRWADRSELADLPFPDANQNIIASLTRG